MILFKALCLFYEKFIELIIELSNTCIFRLKNSTTLKLKSV